MTTELPDQSSLTETPEPGGGVMTGGHKELLVSLQTGDPASVAAKTVRLDQVCLAQVKEDSDLTSLTPEIDSLRSPSACYLEAVYDGGCRDGGQFGLNIAKSANAWREKLTDLVPD